MEAARRGRPPLTPEERQARRDARNQAKRDARAAARDAAQPRQLEPIASITPPAPAPPPPPRLYFAVGEPTTAPTPEPAPIYFALGQRGRALLGFALGAFVPLASYSEVHIEVAHRPLLWFLVAGGLLYSSTSVYSWASKTFSHRLTALGFVVLLELTLTFCGIPWLSMSGLAILMFLNAVNASTTLQQRSSTVAESE